MPDQLSPHASSFSYKVPHEKVRKALYERSYLDNTIQIASPFIKATTTIQHKYLQCENCIGFTLGLHATELDASYQDIFANKESGYPMVGYTYTADGKNQFVYATPPDANGLKINALFDNGNDLVNNVKYGNTPPPGITKATVTRGKSGLLISAQIDIAIPTLSQLEMLHRLFLVPGLGMVLEWGQQFAYENYSNKEGNYGETGLWPDGKDKLKENTFPWYTPGKLKPLLDALGEKRVGIEEVLNCYSYPTEGQYMWMFGRIGNFSVKANSDGSFNATVKIIGPSEDSWAFSTIATVTPPGDASGKVCPEAANSVYSYFTKTTSGINLKTLLDKVSSTPGHPWKDHVRHFPRTSERPGESPTAESNPTPNEQLFGDSDDAYFVTWRFFVNVILNNPKDGVVALFEGASAEQKQVDKVATLKSYSDDVKDEKKYQDKPGPMYIDDTYEAFVGYNKFLRSVDPSTLLLIHEKGADEAKKNFDPKRQEQNPPDYFTPTALSNAFKKAGLFELSDSAVSKPEKKEKENDRACLSAGVWINHKAIVASMMGADTIIRGVSNLLERMSRATANYWNLSLDPVDSINYQCESPGSGKSALSWRVIDSNYREGSQRAVDEFLDHVHIFNKHARKNSEGKLVGSEVIDCNVDLSLPKLLFSQIATMGLVRPKDLQTAGIEAPKPYSKCSDAAIADPNEALREMFAITSLSPDAKNGKVSPDVTYKPVEVPTKQCQDTHTSVPAGVQGQGNQVDGTNANSQALPASGEAANREFPGMNSTFRYIEMFPETMTALIRCDADGNRANAWGASPGALSISADLTLPGIAGLRIGELFWVDRIPSFYKVFGAFQIVSIEDTIDVGNGWQTKIGGRFNYMGEKWKAAMASKAKLEMSKPVSDVEPKKSSP